MAAAAEVIAARFEIGQNSQGLASAREWILEQQFNGYTNILATLHHREHDRSYMTVIMSYIGQPASGVAFGTNVIVGQFQFRNDLTPLVNFLLSAINGLPNPTKKSPTTIAVGTLTNQGTLSVKTTFVGPNGESGCSASTGVAVADNHELVVPAPTPDEAGLATGWNVYIGASGSEKLQNSSPLLFTQSFTLTTAPLTTTAAAPTTNASAAPNLQHIDVIERFQDQLVTVIMSS